jgi:hypothetical protein
MLAKFNLAEIKAFPSSAWEREKQTAGIFGTGETPVPPGKFSKQQTAPR